MNSSFLFYFLSFLITCFIIYWVLLRKKKVCCALTEEDLKPFFEKLDLAGEEKIRKHWLAIFAFSSIYSIILFLNNDWTDHTGESFNFFISLLKGLGMILPGTLITYYFAYIKRGTVWLLVQLITIPIAIVVFYFTTYPEVTPFQLAFFAFDLFIEAYYWFCSLQLFKVNSARKHQKALAMKAKLENASAF